MVQCLGVGVARAERGYLPEAGVSEMTWGRLGWSKEAGGRGKEGERKASRDITQETTGRKFSGAI